MARNPIRRAFVLVVGLLAASLVVARSNAVYTGLASPTSAMTTAAGFSYPTLVTASSPWAYWRFDETSGTSVSDSSGNARTLTLSSTGVTKGVEGALLGSTNRAMSFDGVSGCAITSTTLNISAPVTLEAWVRTTSRSGGLLFGLADTTPQATGQYGYDRQLYFTAAGKIGFGTFFGGSNTILTTSSYNDGRWHLVQGVITGGGNSIYVDGTLVATGTGGGSPTNNYLHVGCGTVHSAHTNAPSSGYLAAEIDEVAFYPSGLSASDVTARWNAADARAPYQRTVTDALPWAYWQLGQGSGGAMADSGSQGNAGTSSGSGLTGSVKGVAPGSLATTFDGAAGCAVSQSSQANPQTFSIETWFKTSSFTGGALVAFNDQSAAVPTGSTARDRHVYMDVNGLVSFGVFDGTTRIAVNSVNAGYNDGTWHHLVATLGAAGQKLYLDGALVGSNANTVAQNFTGWWHLGCGVIASTWPNYSSATYWSGSLDDTAIYAYPLDAGAVAAHYRAGAAALSYTDAVAATNPSVWWRMTDTSHRSIIDSSTNARNGWMSDGGIQFGVPGPTARDAAARFDGSSGCIAAVSSMAAPTPVSIETWIRTTTTTGGWIFGFSGISTPTTSGSTAYDRVLYMRDNGTLTYGTYNASPQTVTSPASYNDGRWHHVVVSTGPSGTSMYVDGQLVSVNAATGGDGTAGYWHAGCGYLAVGWPGKPTSSYFAGDIAEVAAYGTALGVVPANAHWRSANVANAATTARFQSAPWAMWHLDEQAGTTLSDDSGNVRSATASATGVTYGTAGVTGDDTAITLNGSSGCVAGDAVTTNMNPLSVEVWFKTTTTSGGAILSYNTQAGPTTPSSGYDRQLFMRDDGKLAFGVSSGGLQIISTGIAYNDGAWHQAVGTLGPAGLAFYVDGALVASNSGVTTAGNYTAYWHIGCGAFGAWPSPPSSAFFAGSVDEVTVFTNQLDAATIAYRYSLVASRPSTPTTTVAAKPPTLYWKLDETSGTAADSSGNGVTGSAPASGVTRGVAGAVPGGTAWALDGSATPCMSSSSTYVNPTTFTLELWFRTTSTTGAGLMSFLDTTNPATATKWDRHIYMTDAGLLKFAIFDGGAGTSITSTASYNDGAWHHVAATLGSTGMVLYVDGSSVASGAATGVQNFTGRWLAGCGKYQNWNSAPTNWYLDGAIDEVVVTPAPLTTAAIRAHFLAGVMSRPAVVSGSSTAATVIGTGTASSTGDGGAMTSATINEPYAVAVDSAGNVYIAERNGCRLRKIASNGIVSTVAGTGTCGSTSGDGGAATSATINNVEGVAIGPDGSIYVSEGSGHRVRKIATDGTITTYAGTGTAGSSGDGGAATSATISSPRGLAVDTAGNLYIATYADSRVRKVTPGGTISTILGTGTAGFNGDGLAATSTQINEPRALTFGPDGSLYVAEYAGCRIRKLTTGGTVSTVAGTGTCGHTGDGSAATSANLNVPSGIAVDGTGALYISTINADRVRMVSPAGVISTIFGTGTASSSGDGSAASSATVNDPQGLAIDAAGRLLVCDRAGNRIRRLG